MISKKEIITNHCFALLSVLADDEMRNGWRPLTYDEIEEMTGVPCRTAAMLIRDVEDRGERAILWSIATKYGFTFKVNHRGKRKLSVVRIVRE